MRKSRRKSQLLRTEKEQDEISVILSKNPFDRGSSLYIEWVKDQVMQYDIAKLGEIVEKELDLDDEWKYLTEYPCE